MPLILSQFPLINTFKQSLSEIQLFKINCMVKKTQEKKKVDDNDEGGNQKVGQGFK